MNRLIRCILLSTILALVAFPAWSQEDAEGGKDVLYFTRMSNFYIYETNNKEFDAYQFFNGKTLTTVEGKVFQTTYYQKESDKRTSELQIRRNYITAIKNMGGTIIVEALSDLYEDNRSSCTLVTAKVAKGEQRDLGRSVALG